MMADNTLFLAFVGHMVGDYVLQVDVLAAHKKSSTPICTLHCAIWAACVCLLAGWGWQAFVFLMASHYVIDRTQLVK